ncbi:hypothetical protein JTB14_020275 [Gonioctena quinquepunctata]|nr:hypothetical protein JTB14_020275 [Gonioctena quinquepunctata]
MKRQHFAPLLEIVLREKINIDRKKGLLHPWDQINADKENLDPVNEIFLNENQQAVKSLLRMFERFLELKKLSKFKQCSDETWSGDTADKNLFEFWKNVSLGCIQNQVSGSSSEIEPNQPKETTSSGAGQITPISPLTSTPCVTFEAGTSASNDIVVHCTPIKEIHDKKIPTLLNPSVPSPFKRASF